MIVYTTEADERGRRRLQCTICGVETAPTVSPPESFTHQCADQAAFPAPVLATCRHRRGFLRTQSCETCPGTVALKVFGCDLHGQCTPGKKLEDIACCAQCSDFQLPENPPQPPATVTASPCACSGPGWCEAFGRQQTQSDWLICRGQDLPSDECDARRAVWCWEAEQSNHLACCHRGDPLRERQDKTVFYCSVHGACTLVASEIGQVEAACDRCADRLALRPKLLSRRRLDPEHLLPAEHQFNCSLIRYQGKLLTAYRLHWAGARLVIAELNEDQSVSRNHLLRFRLGQAQEDPRLFVYRGELYISYSALQQKGDQAWTDVCYARLEQSAAGTWQVAEEFFPHYVGRSRWEKNWGFFEHDGELLAVYSISPHRVLRIEGNSAELIAEVPIRFPAKPGLLHGGAPPVFHRGEYYAFYHRRLGASAEKWYTLDLYTFEGRFPFRPTRHVRGPLIMPDLKDRPGATVPHAVFPGGAFIDHHDWVVSFGYYDKWSEVARFGINDIEACLEAIPGSPMGHVAHRKGTTDLTFWKEVHDWNEYGLPDRFEPDDLIVDIGAHVGSFTRACLDRGAGCVIAVEPFPASYELLRRNCDYYVNRADLIQAAVGAKPGNVVLRNRDMSGTSYVAVSAHFGGGKELGEAPVLTMADILPAGAIVRLLKIDCEGAEYNALAGADLSGVQEIVGEAHRVQWQGREATMADLEAMLTGFTVTSNDQGNGTWLFRAVRT